MSVYGRLYTNSMLMELIFNCTLQKNVRIYKHPAECKGLFVQLIAYMHDH